MDTRSIWHVQHPFWLDRIFYFPTAVGCREAALDDDGDDDDDDDDGDDDDDDDAMRESDVEFARDNARRARYGATRADDDVEDSNAPIAGGRRRAMAMTMIALVVATMCAMFGVRVGHGRGYALGSRERALSLTSTPTGTGSETRGVYGGDAREEVAALGGCRYSYRCWRNSFNNLANEVNDYKNQVASLTNDVTWLQDQLTSYKNGLSSMTTLASAKNSKLITSDLKSALSDAINAVDTLARTGVQAADDAVKNRLSSLTTLESVKNSPLISSTLKNAVSDAMNAVNAIQQLASATTIQAVDDLNILPGAIENIIHQAQNALESVANGLENKLESLVASIWGGLLDLDADRLVEIVSKSFEGLFQGMFSASSSASLGKAENERAANKSKLLSNLRDELHRAFRGEELTTVRDNNSQAHLGGPSGSGACHTISLSVFEDYEQPMPLMPWPEKFASDSSAPNSLTIKFPEFYFELCQKLNKFNVPTAVAVGLVKAFGDMFQAMFKVLLDESGIPPIIQNVKELGNTFGFNAGRKLLSLSSAQKSDILKQHAELRQRLEKSEAVFFSEVAALHEIFHHPEGFSQPFIARLGEASREIRSVSYSETPRLGSPKTFQGVLKEFQEDLQKALSKMGDVEFSTTTTLTFGIKMGLDVSHTLFKEGDILKDFLDVDDSSVSQVKVIPIFPALSVAIDMEAELALPYFFRAEVAGHFEFDVGISYPITLKLGKKPMITFSLPEVTVKNTNTGYIVSGLQVGVVSQVPKAYFALCTGPICAGVQASARQDVYIGVDVFAQKQSSENNTCFVGPETLRAMWTDWDYKTSTRNACNRSLAGMGGYLQIPKTEVAAGVYLKPLPILDAEPLAGSEDASSDGLQADPAVLIADFTPLINKVYSSEGDWYVSELFHACSSAKSGVNATGCEESCQFTPSAPTPTPPDFPSSLESLQNNFMDNPVCQRGSSFLEETSSVSCATADDVQPLDVTWTGLYMGSDHNAGKQSIYVLSSAVGETQYIALRRSGVYCKMINFVISEDNGQCTYKVNSAGYTGTKDAPCTATTRTEVIAQWYARNKMAVVTGPGDKGYGLKSLKYSMFSKPKFSEEAPLVSCSSVDDVQPLDAMWTGSYVGSDQNVDKQSIYVLSSAAGETQYIALRRSGVYCKMINFVISENNGQCTYKVNSAGYTGTKDAPCTAATRTEVIAEWNARTNMNLVTGPGDKGYGLKSIYYRRFG